MAKIGIIIGSVMAFVFLTTPCSAEGLYGNISAGMAMPLDSDIEQSGFPMEAEQDNGVALGAALGYDFGNIRIEGELTHQATDFSKLRFPGNSFELKGKSLATAFLINGCYDFTNKSAFTPHVSAGLGCVKIEVEDLNYKGAGSPATSDDDFVFAYQGGAGVEYAATEKIAIDLKYRYFAGSDPEFDHTKAEFSTQNIYFGVRYNF